MNKDQVEGKVKDVAGRIERQAGEWTGDKEKQVDGTLKQVEGKVQNAWAMRKMRERKLPERRLPTIAGQLKRRKKKRKMFARAAE